MKKSTIVSIVLIFLFIISIGLMLLSIASTGFTIGEAKIGRFLLEEETTFEDESRTEIITEVYENTGKEVVVMKFEETNYKFNAFDKKELDENRIKAMENALGEDLLFKAQMKGSGTEIYSKPGYKYWIEFTPEVRKISGIYQSLNIFNRKIKNERISIVIPVLIDGKAVAGKTFVRHEKIGK